MTRIFIAADIEGCTGVAHHDQLMEGQPRKAVKSGEVLRLDDYTFAAQDADPA